MVAQPNMRLADEASKRSMPLKVNFTAPSLKAAKCPAGKGRIYLYDAVTPGLAIQVAESGKKSFYLVRRITGQANRMRLGGFPDVTIEQARDLVKSKTGEIAQGVNVFAEKTALRKDSTLGEVWDKWYENFAKPRLRNSTLVKDESLFRTCFSDWKNRRVNTITSTDVQRKLESLGMSNGPTTANRSVQLLRRLLNYGKVKNNPAALGKGVFFHEEKRKRPIINDELARLIASIEAEPNETMADFCRLCLWTGQRRGNVLSMRWDELDLTAATWNIPGSKFKTGEPLAVPLVKSALDLLANRKGNKSEYVFPGRNGEGCLAEPKAGWKRILKRAKITNLHIHDLRHNMASFAVNTGASLYSVGQVLGHADSVSTQRYAHMALDPIRATITAATDAMSAAVEASKAEAAKEAAEEAKKATA